MNKRNIMKRIGIALMLILPLSIMILFIGTLTNTAELTVLAVLLGIINIPLFIIGIILYLIGSKRKF